MSFHNKANRTIAAGAFGVCLLAGTCLAGAADLVYLAKLALSNEQDPGVFTSELLIAGHDPARAAHAVAEVWNDCAASQAAVAVAVTTHPEAAAAIVSAVGTVDGCACAQGGGWSRTRLEGRIRFDAPQRPVGLADACSCLTAAVEAGVAAAPQHADRIVMASLEALQQETVTLDSIGARGSDETEGWNPGMTLQAPTGFRRKPDICSGDRNDADEFEPGREWEPFKPGRNPGRPVDQCDDDRDLMITEFVADPGGAGYIQLYNGTDDTIDLAAKGYRIGLSYAGQRNHNILMPMHGTVQPGNTYLIAGRHSDAAGIADELVNILNLSPGDAVSLHRPAPEENCECSDAVAGGAMRGSTAGIAGPEEGNVAQHKMTRLAGINEHANGIVVDSVGQVGPVENADQSAPDGQNKSVLNQDLSRAPGWCEPDSYELDAFSAQGWQPGGKWGKSCTLPESDLVISGIVIRSDSRDAISLLNGSSRDIDLERGGYYLEIYQPGELAPSREIALEGTVSAGNAFLLAHEEAPDEIRMQADRTLNTLSLNQSSAVVLSRRQFDRPLFCRDPLAAFLQVPAGPVFFIQDVPVEGREPLDEPPRVDPVASPN